MGRNRREIPWLDTRDNGIFYAYWYDAGSKQTRRESLDTSDVAEARRKFGQFLVDGPKSARSGGDAGVTVAQALDWYDRGIPGKFQGHVESKVVDKERQRAAIRNLRVFFNKTLMKDVDVALTEAYATARRQGKVGHGINGFGHGRARKDGTANLKLNLKGADNTIRRELGALGAAAAFCIKRDMLPLNHAPRIERPPEPKTKAPWFDKDAIRMIFNAAEGQLKAFCRLTYYWGARRDSVETLRVSQIDLKHGRVDLHKPGTPVTRKRKAIVPIYPEIRKDIETLLLDTDNEYLFGRPAQFYYEFVELCARHNIRGVDLPDGKTPWPHMLRHSRATHMLMDGDDIYKVAKLLGDTVQTVEKTYGHVVPEYLHTKSNVETGTNSGA